MIPRSRSAILTSKMWKMYADYLHSKHERFLVWNLIEPYVRPKSFTPIVTVYVAAFYTGVIGAAISEQLYKEKYWEEHPGHVVPLKKPTYYHGPWKVAMGEVPAHLRRTE